MPRYAVNKNAQSGSGDHEVHDLASRRTCLPSIYDRIDLGQHPNCESAVRSAKQYYRDVNGCAHCANDCHTT